ncbi:conserved hypothetical protein [Paraburkholderia tropica]|uniref:hypothetical protein n=1 Tax=Paraburkholderia tropica TaxID=92647 RepID=UPI001CB2A7F8|nr:hypothetical protein [Paraburkholderia tropica]CAG9194529.1 conserved hypothetical protein [Paraburkholderia tropica]
MSEAQTIKDRVNRQIAREIEISRKRMGEEEWKLHGTWVTENIVAAAKIWIMRALREGSL